MTLINFSQINEGTELQQTVKALHGGNISGGIMDSMFLLKRNTVYALGDVVCSPNLPSYLRLECVSPGTTGATEPDFASMST